MPEPSDSGGPSNLRGIHYQLLSSLGEVGTAVAVLDHKGEGSDLSSVTLVIEPAGGGDSAILETRQRRVQQIKTSAQTWTLAGLSGAKGPLRDLFRAAQNDPAATVEFITNSNLNAEASAFSEFLAQVSGESGGSARLDCRTAGQVPLSWFRGGRDSRYPRTLEGLVDYLVARCCGQQEDTDRSSLRERVCAFLARLALRADVSFEGQEDVCKGFLEGRGIAPENLSSAIDQIVGLLLRRGAAGNQALTLTELSLELNLAQRSLDDWSSLCSLGCDLLARDLGRPRPGYSASADVRSSDPLSRLLTESISAVSADEALANQVASPIRPSPIVLCGKTGLGKTWLLARAASALVRLPASVQVMWITSEQDPRDDLDAASRKFCHQVWGIERTLSIHVLAGRVRRRGGPRDQPWLVLFIDGVQRPEYFEQLAQLGVPEVGVLPVVATTAELSDASAARHGLRLLHAPGFDADEVLRFLQLHDLASQRIPPDDVRQLLATPAFCALYASLKPTGAAWQPEDEYQLMDRYWGDRLAGPHPGAADVLARLACARLQLAAQSTDRPSGSAEAWTIAELRTAGLYGANLGSLEREGVMLRDSWNRSYSFRWERSLQWAAAEGAVRLFAEGALSATDLSDLCTNALIGDRRARWTFGYVPADLLWLLLDPMLPSSFALAAERILTTLETHHEFRQLRSWLATLGRRAVPALFRRLRAADVAHRRTYRDVLEEIQASEVAQFATELLGEPEFDLQSIGVYVLASRTHPDALDPLWDLHEQWWAAAHAGGSPGNDPESGPGFWHVDICERALRRSVRNCPDWLERHLAEASDLVGPRSTLLYLLASMPGAETAWRRLKDVLRDRLDPGRQRGFVRCIVAFRDSEEVPWLRNRVNEPRDSVAAAAREALALLDPEAALAPVDPAVQADVAIARGWWLLPAWATHPEEAALFLRDHVLATENPSQTAWMYSGFEFWWPTELIDAVVSAVMQALASYRAGTVPENKDPLFGPLLRLSACQSLPQLEHLWEVGPEGLDAELASWLISSGPNNGSWERITEREAIKVLGLLGGHGATRSGCDLLRRATTWAGGKDGLDLCVRAADGDALAAIRGRALDRTPSAEPIATEHPVLQRLCTVALAYLRDFEGFARAVLEWGLLLPPDLVRYLDDTRRAPPILEVARRALDESPIRPGALMLLGLHGSEEAVALLHSVARQALGADSDMKVAWIAGLDISGDRSPETLDAFVGHLESDDERLSFSSQRALARRLDNPRAAEALMSLVAQNGKSADASRALLETETLQPRAADLVWQHRKRPWFPLYFGHQIDRFSVLETPEVRAYLLERATTDDAMAPWARWSAIRGLANLDSDSAFRAALALRGSKEPQPGEWASLMLEVSCLEALPHLKDEFAAARTLVRLHGIGEALRIYGQQHVIEEWLEDQDPKIREGACHASCAQEYSLGLETILRRCCGDADDDVRGAAQRAIQFLRRDRETARLIERLRTEVDAGKRWALMDAALALGYPGVRPGFGQVCWYSEFVSGSAYYKQKHCEEALKRRRKDLVTELERASRSFREDA